METVENKKPVRLWVWIPCNGKFSIKAKYFEELLIEEFKDNLKYDGISEKIKILSNLDLYDAFFDNVSLDLDFAKSLHLHDIISSKCLLPLNEIGQAFIELLSYSDIEFIVYKREHYSTNNMCINLYCCHIDYTDEVFRMLRNREVIN
jgi:hypothetical protein